MSAFNYRVEVKAAAHSRWTSTGIIESDKEVANRVWTEIIRDLRYHSFRLFAITYGVPIERGQVT